MKEISVREWIRLFNRGEYKNPSFKVQCDAGWYDWFCEDGELAGRLAKMGKIISRLKNDFLLDNYYVWFKNNCPMVGPLYDDFRFDPLDESLRDKVYFGVACDDERNKNRFEVFTSRNGYKTEFVANSEDELVAVLERLGEELKQTEDL